MLFGKRFYLSQHQGITHALPLAPLYAALLILPLAFAGLPLDHGDYLLLWLAALAGLLLHLLLDWLNTFRIALFAPLSFRRYSADALFFVDATALSITALFYVAHFLYGFTWAAAAYALVMALYLLLRFGMRRVVERRLHPLFAIPRSLSPFTFFLLESDGEALSGCRYNLLTGHRSDFRHFPPEDREALELAETSPLFRQMRSICRCLRLVELKESEKGVRIRAVDAAVRNYGGRFGRTELLFDREGRLLHEVADI